MWAHEWSLQAANFYLKKLLLLRKTEYLGADDAGAGLQGEHGADERLRLTLPLHHGRDLDHRVFVGLWENSCCGEEFPVVKSLQLRSIAQWDENAG